MHVFEVHFPPLKGDQITIYYCAHTLKAIPFDKKSSPVGRP